MTSIIYCGECTMPQEYCRYHPKYNKCLAWLKANEPDLFAIEIKDIEARDPKTAKKARYLWDGSVVEEKSEAKTAPTKKVKILEKKITKQQQISTDQMTDIESKLAALSTKNTKNESPSKSILKNPKNPNLEHEQQKLAQSIDNSDEEEEEDKDNSGYLGRGGNRNKARGAPPRKDTKKRRRGKKNRGRDKRKRQEEEEEENKENGDEEDKPKVVRFYEKMGKAKIPKNIVEVQLENRKGNKKVTLVRGFIEKSKDKEQRIKSEFMKKFATSVNITFQNPGSDKGPKQVVLMGDKRYDFMRYLKEKFPGAGKLLYYKSKKHGLTPAVNVELGFVLPPPK